LSWWPANRDGQQLESPISCPASSRKGVGIRQRGSQTKAPMIERPNKDIYTFMCLKAHLTILYPVLKKK
jgi:hypothetical protein